MSKDLLLEIGTEEVPAHAMPGILDELAENAKKALDALRLEYKDVSTVGTPRRTALLVSGLSERQPDVESERRGPSVQAAFDADGNPTKAAQGFARGQKVDPSALVKKDGYVYAMVHETGAATETLLRSTTAAISRAMIPRRGRLACRRAAADSTRSVKPSPGSALS